MEFAKIKDRILVNANKEQLYGMQFTYDDQKNLIPFPIQNPQLVDQGRKKIDLEPIKKPYCCHLYPIFFYIGL